MFEKEAKKRARDFTDNKERQIAYECGFLDGANRMKEIVNASPNLGRGKGYKMCVVDEFHDIKELEEINADLKKSLDWANEREKKLKVLIEKMKCCENCKHSDTECEGHTICGIGHYGDCLSNKVLYHTTEEGQGDYIAIKQAYLAGLKAGRPQWHKVADGDLPKDENDVLVYSGEDWRKSVGMYSPKHKAWESGCDAIAWCEIPEYEGE